MHTNTDKETLESLRESGLVSQKVTMFVETVETTAPTVYLANLAPFGAIVS